MSDSYHKGWRSVYKLTAHIVLVVKYRHKLINSERLAKLNEIFDANCQKWECTLIEFNGEADHVHLLVDYHPKIELSKFIANLKTVSSRLLRRDYEDLAQRKTFWTGAYFVASCGGVTVDQLKAYVENQARMSE